KLIKVRKLNRFNLIYFEKGIKSGLKPAGLNQNQPVQPGKEPDQEPNQRPGGLRFDPQPQPSFSFNFLFPASSSATRRHRCNSRRRALFPPVTPQVAK
ncbi:hypothetical protein LINPERHAP1_LOCUS20851, partial [Linum perenne]